MEDLVTITFYLGLIAYSAASTLFWVELGRREGFALAQLWAPRLLGAAFVAHLAHILSASVLTHVCPVRSLHFALSLTAVFAVGAYLASRRRLKVHAMGAFVAPIALVLLVGAQFVGTRPTDASAPRTLLAVHVTANILGMGLFVLAGAAGIFYLVQERQLRGKRGRGMAARLPPLDVLDHTEHRLLLAGFPMLTLGVVTGAVVLHGISGSSAPDVMRSALAYTTWLLLGGVLLLRAVAGWRGRRAAYGTIAGAACLVLVILVYVLRPVGGAL
jgi:ABC-type uncharacterized transport system permease subunit